MPTMKNEHATHDDVKGCRKQWRVHLTATNPRDHSELDDKLSVRIGNSTRRQ
jgi:hypothetical protein